MARSITRFIWVNNDGGQRAQTTSALSCAQWFQSCCLGSTRRYHSSFGFNMFCLFFMACLCIVVQCFALLFFALLCLAFLGLWGNQKGVTCNGFLGLLCFALLYFALHRYALHCFALHCFALLCFALICYAWLCFALLCIALLCLALLGFALLCFGLLCFDMQPFLVCGGRRENA